MYVRLPALSIAFSRMLWGSHILMSSVPTIYSITSGRCRNMRFTRIEAIMSSCLVFWSPLIFALRLIDMKIPVNLQQIELTFYCKYSRTLLNSYPSVVSLNCGLRRAMSYERQLLMQSDILVPQKHMGYGTLGLWVMRPLIDL